MSVSTPHWWPSFTVVFICAIVLPAVPGHAQTLPASIAACARETNDGRRLACYDRAVADFDAPAAESRTVAATVAPTAPTAPISAPSAATAAATAAAAAPLTPEEKFGLEGKLEEEAMAPVKSATPNLNELSGTVAEIAKDAQGRLIVTLTNGQVWTQKKRDSRYFPLAVNDEVKIRARSFGSYAMYDPQGRFLQVTRVK